MLTFTTLLSLSALAPLLSVSGLAVKRSGCSLSNLKLSNLPPPLVAPSFPPSFVGIAIGTQNYTCSSAGTYTNVGALAELFDASCVYNSPIFPTLPSIASAAWEIAPPSLPISEVISTLHGFSSPSILGQHYYVTNPITGSGITPKWDFTSQGADAGKSDAFVVAAKVNGAAAPTGSQDIDWVQLGSLTGDLAKQVYRVQTRLGQPPASCTVGSKDIQVKYAALYYGFGGSV
ncbi:hypothetical protein JR316_0009062 [Psilocybe cubensis]|uniref:Malate dehydrogenase n=2 Tax=Psilocybe cubensis TaxID=181762 RepID=A0A8H8CKN5_PSICU|nr:hypothetical protein JR316_0009062 [Psilocybe cubensis]KAH9478605.1 hypothetical protein JR316_0009062 [Psilocybe cubensis]